MWTLRWTAAATIVVSSCWFAAGDLAASDAQIGGEKKVEQIKETGEFDNTTPKDREKTESPCRLYALTCVAGRTYTIDLSSSDFDAYLRLEDNGKIIKEDDDSGGGAKGLDARLIFKAEKSGAYTIVATSYNPGARGKYTLTVVHDGSGGVQEFKYLLDVSAKLTKDDPKDKERGGGSYCKTYKVEMQADATYVVRLDSRDFDAYIRLLDSTGKEVASDDDGAKDGLNSLLTYQSKKAGDYTIVATTFAPLETGEFTLKVNVKN